MLCVSNPDINLLYIIEIRDTMYNYEGNEPQKIVGKQICVLRKRFKLTQASLASGEGMEESALQRIKAGSTNPTIKTL
jgi:DNA-binding XRE family transcriptional regulator